LKAALEGEFLVVGLVKSGREAYKPGKFLLEVFPMNDLEIERRILI